MAKKDYKKNNNNFKKRVTNQDILSSNAFKSTRDAEWFKKTVTTIDKIKADLDNKFFNEEKRAQKIDFIRILKTKIKDYKDAQNNANLYKSIRFFERRKLERQLKQINKKIDTFDKENSNTSIDELEKEKAKIIDDINYVKVSFPLYNVYISIIQ